MNYNPKIGHIGLVLVLGAESSAIFYYLGLARGENRGVDIGETRNEPVTVAYSDVDKDGYDDIIVQTRYDEYVFFGDLYNSKTNILNINKVYANRNYEYRNTKFINSCEDFHTLFYSRISCSCRGILARHFASKNLSYGR